jgi:hypothetical protein
MSGEHLFRHIHPSTNARALDDKTRRANLTAELEAIKRVVRLAEKRKGPGPIS